MMRTAIIGTCAVVIFVAVMTYRYSHRLAERVAAEMAPEPQPEPGKAEVVLPPVSSAWSNFGAHTVVTNRPGPPMARSISNAASPPFPVEATVNLDPSVIQARVREIMARVSLDSLGVDPEADQYWLTAINDTTVPAEIRRELILALEQAGFADPARVNSDDLPLIVSRIALIEQLAPNAIDNVNAAAFEQAYQALLAMFSSVAGPEPVATTTTAAGVE